MAPSRVATSHYKVGHWSDGLPVVDVMRQFGIDPNAVMTTEGKLQTPDGLFFESSSSESGDSLGGEDDGTVVPQEHPQTNSQDSDENAKDSGYSKRNMSGDYSP